MELPLRSRLSTHSCRRHSCAQAWNNCNEYFVEHDPRNIATVRISGIIDHQQCSLIQTRELLLRSSVFVDQKSWAWSICGLTWDNV